MEASRLRRLIAEQDDTPDPLIHELRACADVAERRGVTVSLHTAGETPYLSVEQRRALTELPMHVLAAARTWARATVVTPADQPETEVSVVADTELGDLDDAAGGDVEVHVTRDGEALWVRTRLRRNA